MQIIGYYEKFPKFLGIFPSFLVLALIVTRVYESLISIQVNTESFVPLDSFAMVKKTAPAVKMKTETIVQRQLNFQHASSYVLTARVLQRRESVTTSRTVITAWTKPIVLV